MAYHTMATGDAELRTLQAEVRTLAWRMTTGDADVRTLAWRMATGDADVRTLQAEVRTLAWRMTSGDADVRTLQAEVRTLAWRMAYGDEELRTLQAEVRTFQPGMRTFHWMTRYADDLQGHRTYAMQANPDDFAIRCRALTVSSEGQEIFQDI